MQRSWLAGRRISRIAAIALIAGWAMGSDNAKGSGTGAPTVVAAGEIGQFGGAVSFNHVILLWDERLDERVGPVPSDFTVTLCSPSPCTGTPYVAAAANYLLGGLGGPEALFGDPSGVTFIRLDLPDGVTVNDTSSIQITYHGPVGQCVDTPTRLRDLSLTCAADFTIDATVYTGIDQRFLTPIVDADHGLGRLALVFTGQIDPASIPSPTSFTVMVTRPPLAPFSDAVTAVELVRGMSSLPARVYDADLGIGILDLLLEKEIAHGDIVSVTNNGSDIKAKSGGASFDYQPINNAQAILYVPLNSTSVMGATTATTSTGSAPTVFDPVATTVNSPTAGNIAIKEIPLSPSPIGYSFFGQEVVITTSAVASAANPFVLRFVIDASLVTAPIVILRNGVPVGLCDPLQLVAAAPDPCRSPPEPLADGDIAITVRTSAASTWNFATVRPYAFGGFLRPVDNRPVVNTTKAGSAIPVKFSLGGDRGMAIFAAGSPASQTIACDAYAPLDPVETTVSPGSSTLTYSPGTDVYTYIWKTDKAWADTCRKLLITFGDGSTAVALFKFGK